MAVSYTPARDHRGLALEKKIGACSHASSQTTSKMYEQCGICYRGLRRWLPRKPSTYTLNKGRYNGWPFLPSTPVHKIFRLTFTTSLCLMFPPTSLWQLLVKIRIGRGVAEWVKRSAYQKLAQIRVSNDLISVMTWLTWWDINCFIFKIQIILWKY